MKAKISTLPFSPAEITEHEFTAKANELLREFDTILARTRRKSERIARLERRTQELRAALRKG